MSQPQANNQNPLTASERWNLVTDDYADTTMLVFEQFAEVVITASKPNSTVLNVACGPCMLALKLALSSLQETLLTLKSPLTSDAGVG